MAALQQDDSYEQYKSYLQNNTTKQDISRPPRIMTAFDLFCFVRKAEERGKRKGKLNQLKKKLQREWKKMNESKKQCYTRLFQVRKKQHDELKAEFDLLMNDRKMPNAYICYFRKKYPIQSIINRDLNQNIITKMIASDWKNLDDAGKFPYQLQAKVEKQRMNIIRESMTDVISSYEYRIKQFKKLILEDKQKILRKYGVSLKYLNRQQKKMGQISDDNEKVKKKGTKNKIKDGIAKKKLRSTKRLSVKIQDTKQSKCKYKTKAIKKYEKSRSKQGRKIRK